MEITNINQLDLVNGVYTYADYLLWKFKERVELFRGKVFKMSPAPAATHQIISGNLYRRLYKSFENYKCALFSAPFDVVLKDNNGKDTVVQPDLFVVCDPTKIEEKGCMGSPDLIIEILSPGNSKKEMDNKFQIYQDAGVAEYWIVSPSEKYVLIYSLDDNGIYRGSQPFIEGQKLVSVKFPAISIAVKTIFKRPF